MKKQRYCPKHRTSTKAYWFFRSLWFSGVLMLCTLALLLGGAKCYAVMQTNITGNPIQVLELRGQAVLVLGHEVLRLNLPNRPEQ